MTKPARYEDQLFRTAAQEVFEQGHITGATAAKLTAIGINVPALERRLLSQQGHP